MEYKEIKDMSLEQLNKKAQELKKNLFEMRMKNTMGQLNNPLEVRTTRKSIAKVLTAIRQQALAAPATTAVKAKSTKAKKTATKAKKTKKK
jgi:large subunit ribosomal protein L29